jgi:hypothetical protein
MAAATSDSKKLSFAESCLELPALSIEIRVLCSRDIYTCFKLFLLESECPMFHEFDKFWIYSYDPVS